MRVFVTGGSGFIGSAVVRLLLERHYEVRVLVRKSSRLDNLINLPVKRVTGDLNDPESLVNAARSCQAIFHVAADYRLWVPNPVTLYQTNIQGTKNILQAATLTGVERLVYTSSVATIGFTQDGSPADEDTPVAINQMIGHYKRSKFEAEQAVLEWTQKGYGASVIVNPSTPIGPRDIKPTPTGKMIWDAATGRMPAYVDTGLNIVHVDDVATGHLLAFDHGRIGQRYILGGTDLTLHQILEQVSEFSGNRVPRLRLPIHGLMPVAYLAEAWGRWRGKEPRITMDALRLAQKHMFFSSAKAIRELGYQPRPVSEAFRDAVGWFLNQRPRPFSGIEQDSHS